MANQPSLPDILKGSDAYKSLMAEQEVASCLARLGWSTRQGPYYLDGKTEKLRELDIAASSYWRKSLKAGDLVARVDLFIEVKTNRDFHILCAGPTKSPSSFATNEYWIGYNDEAKKRIEELLRRYQLKHEETLDFLHNVEKIAFPNDMMVTSTLRLKPPPIEHCFSAFRETNGKVDKELDNSVLWRAISVLRSAVTSAQAGRIDALAEDLDVDLEVARREELPFQYANNLIDSHARSIHLFLPVVVIQSRIWSARVAIPEEIKWARLVQFGTFGDAQHWVDVVNFDHLEEYLNMQSRYFERAFRKARATRWI